MKLQMTFKAGGEQKTALYQWDYQQDFADNMAAAVDAAAAEGFDRKDMDHLNMKAIKERDGERCPCCNEPL